MWDGKAWAKCNLMFFPDELAKRVGKTKWPTKPQQGAWNSILLCKLCIADMYVIVDFGEKQVTVLANFFDMFNANAAFYEFV